MCFDEEDLLRDNMTELIGICAKAKNADVKKLEEDVYICYDLSWGKSCRDIFSQRIKCKEFI